MRVCASAQYDKPRTATNVMHGETYFTENFLQTCPNSRLNFQKFKINLTDLFQCYIIFSSRDDNTEKVKSRTTQPTAAIRK